MNSTIFFHEDFYRQIELIPEENYFKTHNSIEDLPQKETSQYGFLTATSRKEHTIKTGDKHIDLEEINKLLSPLAYNYFDDIESGYGNTVVKRPHTIAWGFERYGIFIESNNRKQVLNIWICSGPQFIRDQRGQRLFDALTIIGRLFHLILIDWDREVAIRISNPQITYYYLNETYSFTPDY